MIIVVAFLSDDLFNQTRH